MFISLFTKGFIYTSQVLQDFLHQLSEYWIYNRASSRNILSKEPSEPYHEISLNSLNGLYRHARLWPPLSLSLSPGISILYVIHSLEGHLSFCPQNAKCVILPIWVNRNKIFDQARFFSLKSGHSGKRDSYYQAAYDSTWFLTFIYHKARTKTVNFVTPFLWYLPPSGPMIFTQTPLNC